MLSWVPTSFHFVQQSEEAQLLAHPEPDGAGLGTAVVRAQVLVCHLPGKATFTSGLRPGLPSGRLQLDTRNTTQAPAFHWIIICILNS